MRLLDRAVDHKVTVLIIRVLTNRDRELRHLAVWVECSEQHSLRRIREVDEVRLCGRSWPSFPLGP